MAKHMARECEAEKQAVNTAVQRAKVIGNQAMLWRETAVLQRALTGIKQTGANCGIFAMAMALQEFLGGDGGEIAKQLERIAVANGYSNIGEMFDADNLAAVGNEFLEHFTGPCKCCVVDFENDGQLGKIMKLTKEGKVRILFPYASLGAVPQVGEEGAEAIKSSDDRQFQNTLMVIKGLSQIQMKEPAILEQFHKLLSENPQFELKDLSKLAPQLIMKLMERLKKEYEKLFAKSDPQAPKGQLNGLTPQDLFGIIINNLSKMPLGIYQTPLQDVETNLKGQREEADRDEPGRLSPVHMHHAHWSVVNTVEDEKATLFEGHLTMNDKPAVSFTNLFQSNQLLGSELDWRGYNPFVSSNFLNDKSKKKRSAPFSERVNLSGKAILVGLNSEVDQAIHELQTEHA